MKLSTQMLLEAYQLGFFPMAESRDSDELMWVKPIMRGVFPLDGFRMSKSLRKVVRQDRFEVRLDSAFTEVMQLCASKEAGREETWINQDILASYRGLHEIGHAHSVECWREGTLVGGLYGVSIKGAFFGESMFSLATDASKVALCHLIARLQIGGYQLLDSQFLTDHLESLGAVEVPAEDYEVMLADSLKVQGNFYALDRQASGSSIVQSITQTS